MRRQPLALALVLTVAAASCSSDNNADRFIPNGPTTVATTGTATSGSTTAASTTQPGQSAVATTTTVVPPATTSLTDVKQDVIAGFEAGEKAYLAALTDPANFDPATIRATYSGQAAENVIRRLEDYRAAGWRVRPGTLNLEYYVVQDVRLLNGPPATRSDLFSCEVSDSVVYDPRNPDDPSDDATVNADFASRQRQWTMVLEDGAWKRQIEVELDKRLGENICPPPGS